jgi:hypothetical protein
VVNDGGHSDTTSNVGAKLAVIWKFVEPARHAAGQRWIATERPDQEDLDALCRAGGI